MTEAAVSISLARDKAGAAGFSLACRRLYVWLLIGACFVFPGPLQAGDQGETKLYDDVQVRLHCPGQYQSRIYDLVVKCEKNLDQRLPFPSPGDDIWTTVVVTSPEAKPPLLAPMGNVILLKTDFSAQTVVFSVSRGLLDRRFLSLAATKASVDWLAAGVAFDLLYARSPDGAAPDYGFMAKALKQNRVPSLPQLVACPALPEWPYAFRLYAAWSHAACSILAATPAGEDSALEYFVRQLGGGTAIKDAWETTWEALDDKAGTPASWFAQASRKLVQNTQLDARQLALEDSIRDVMGVAVLAPGPDGLMKYRKVAIQDLRERFPDARLDTESLNIKERRIFELLKQVPLQLQKPLANYMGALQERKSGKSWNAFLNLLEKADADLADALARYRGTRLLLDELEAQYGHDTPALIPCLIIAAEHRQAERRLAPGLSAFLDSFP